MASGNLLCNSGMCDDLERGDVGRGGEGDSRRRGYMGIYIYIYTYLWVIHVVVWQKPTQHGKAIFHQLKKKFLKVSLGPWMRSLISLDTRDTTAAAAKQLQSCPTLCDPIDGSPLGSAVPGILQARTLEWVAISYSNAWKWKVKVKSLSRVWLFTTPWTEAYQAPPSTGFSRQEYWSGVPLPNKSYPKLELSVSSFIPKENQKGYGPKQ